MALKASYADVAYADVVLATNTAWLALSSTVRQDALTVATYYLDSNFTCLFDQEIITDEMKTANALLAADYIDGGLYSAASTVKRELIKAGPVTIENEYLSGNSFEPASLDRVKALLAADCTYISNNTVFVIR